MNRACSQSEILRCAQDDNFGWAPSVRPKPDPKRRERSFKFDIFPKRTGSSGKRLIAFTSLPSGVLISGNFENSGNRPRLAGARATLPVEHTDMKRRRLPQGDSGGGPKGHDKKFMFANIRPVGRDRRFRSLPPNADRLERDGYQRPQWRALLPKVRFGFEIGHPSALMSCPLSATSRHRHWLDSGRRFQRLHLHFCIAKQPSRYGKRARGTRLQVALWQCSTILPLGGE